MGGRHCHAVRMGRFVYGKSTQASRFETLFGHRGAVQSVVFSRDGRRALSSGSDATVRYWDIDKGEELQRFEGHSGIVYSAVFAGDERQVLTCGQDRTLRSWDAATGQQLKILDVNNRPIRSIAVSHDDRRRLGWRRRGRPGVGLATGAELHRLEGHTGQIWHVAISPDGQMGLTAGQDRTILMWDLRTGTLVSGFLGHEGDVNNLVFSPMGSGSFPSVTIRRFASGKWRQARN